MTANPLHPQLLIVNNELNGLCTLLESILVTGQRNGIYLELLGCLLSIDFQQEKWDEFCKFRETYVKVGGEFTSKGWDRATRVYTNPVDKPTKPSYLKRLIAYPDKPRRDLLKTGHLNQLEKISLELSKKPGYSNLSFVVLRPADLHDQFRPGYVPCVISGDFKFRKGKLDLNVMFRTSDALTVGYGDIYYMRNLQMQVLNLAKGISKNAQLKESEIGLLNMYLCRTYIQRTLKSKNGVHVNGEHIATQLTKSINELEGHNT